MANNLDSKILNQEYGKSQERAPLMSGNGLASMTTLASPTTQEALHRAERTSDDLGGRSAVAVSAGIQQGYVGGGVDAPLLAPATTNQGERGAPSALHHSPAKYCGTLASLAECEGGHHFAKRRYCGQEWCPICGKHRSAAHNRRISRLLPKVQQIRSMGYLVIEFPEWARFVGHAGFSPDPIRGWCRSRADLRATVSDIVEVLAGKRCGRKGRINGFFERGLARWHWFGDKIPGKWNPHLNVLVDGEYIEPDKLEEIKAALRGKLNIPDLIVHYSYCDTPGQMFQKVEYITRATFTNADWSPYMVHELWNFRNTRWWGKWQDASVWYVEHIDADTTGLAECEHLAEGVCPDCGAELKTLYRGKGGRPVKWTKPVMVDEMRLAFWGAEEIGRTGYYRLHLPEYSEKGGLSPADYIRLSKLEARVRKRQHYDVALLAIEKKPPYYETESYWESLLNSVPG